MQSLHPSTFQILLLCSRIHDKTGAKANSAQEREKRENSKDRERNQGEAAGEEEEADWEKAGEEKRERTHRKGEQGEKRNLPGQGSSEQD